MLDYTDDVNGTVIGSITTSIGGLYYDGRKQGKTFYAQSDDELIRLSNEQLEKIKLENGEFVFKLIYPEEKWEIRIY